MNSRVWVHDLSPIALQISDSFRLHWYGLAYLAGFSAGALLICFVLRRGKSPLTPRAVLDFMPYLVVGTMLGGRIGYAALYAPKLFTNAEFFKVWHGGMASHGGIIGAALAVLVFARVRGVA